RALSACPCVLSLSPVPRCPGDVSDREMMLKIINSAINTKALSHWSGLACSIALDAVRTVETHSNGRKEIDIKKYAKVEKVRVHITLTHTHTHYHSNSLAHSYPF